jgi:CMP-N-acetylneuraminic acid synthetase
MARIIGLVPLRSGSKRISYKNIKEIAGKPLAYWVCRAAKESHHISEVYVSAEDEIIRDVIESFDLGIQVLERPRELATDTKWRVSAHSILARGDGSASYLLGRLGAIHSCAACTSKNPDTST